MPDTLEDVMPDTIKEDINEPIGEEKMMKSVPIIPGQTEMKRRVFQSLNEKPIK